MMVYKVQNPLNINRRFVGRRFQYIRLIVEIAVLLTINERDSSCSILTILQRLYDCYPIPVSSQTAYGKDTLIEQVIQRLTKHLAMQNYFVT